MEDIALVIKNLKFRKSLFGGLSEKSVWKKLEFLQSEYRSAYEKQAAIYEDKLREKDEKIASLEAQIKEAGGNE